MSVNRFHIKVDLLPAKSRGKHGHLNYVSDAQHSTYMYSGYEW